VYSATQLRLLFFQEEPSGANCTAILAGLVQGMRALLSELETRPRLRELLGDPQQTVVDQAIEMAHGVFSLHEPAALQALEWEAYFGTARTRVEVSPSGQVSRPKRTEDFARFEDQDWIYGEYVDFLYQMYGSGRQLRTYPWPKTDQRLDSAVRKPDTLGALR